MAKTSFIVVLITAGSAVEAEKISQALVERRLAACVSNVAEVSSRFWWQDKLDTARESLLIVKTRSSLLPDIIKEVKKIHGYSVPEIIALSIVDGNQDYLNWIDREVTRQGPKNKKLETNVDA
jgi:periplasmic divalent cation tolerance protein